MRLRNKKTGKFGEYKVISAGFLIRVKDCNSDESWQYDCLAGFIEDWEDYKPAEPLIKDEKVRKAVRAWAEANEVEELAVMCHSVWEATMTEIAKIDNASLRIVFSGDLGIKRGYTITSYTITELCGGEEEPEDDDDEEDLRAEEY